MKQRTPVKDNGSVVGRDARPIQAVVNYYVRTIRNGGGGGVIDGGGPTHSSSSRVGGSVSESV